MLRYLNQLNFKAFGTVPPERISRTGSEDKSGHGMNLSLTQGVASVYRTLSDTKVYLGSGNTILSVSLDGENFEQYYLDKYVCLNHGVYFCMSACYQEESSITLRAAVLPELISSCRKIDDVRLAHHLRITELYAFFYQERERGFVFSGEAHPMFELTYVDQGTLHSVVDGQDTVLQQGELTIYGSNQWHMQYADMDTAPRFVTISFDLETPDMDLLINRKFVIPQRSASLLTQLMQEQEHLDKYSSDLIIALLTQLLINLLRSKDSPASRLKASNSVHSENEIIRRAQQYISTHIREKLSVPTVSRMVDVSPSYLTALFHKNLQISPGEYIRRIKLQESKQMIRENSMNFTEIAAALQYSTVHHFSRQFKEKFGITPTQYAKSVRSF